MLEIRDADAAVRYIESRGILLFLPCGVPGFSLYENMEPELFETDEKSLNPWYWRFEFAYVDDLFYGQFFDGRLGFVRRDLFPAFAALRRKGRTPEELLESGEISEDAKTFYRALPQEYAGQSVTDFGAPPHGRMDARGGHDEGSAA